MKKYIDAEKLKAELERRQKMHYKGDGPFAAVQFVEDTEILYFIDSLQHEESTEDLEKEISRFLESEESTTYENAGSYKVAVKDPKKIARHFCNFGYELGLNARKED